MRIRSLIVLLVGVAECALAQQAIEPALRGDLGLRYWLSTGKTTLSHNGQEVSPILGNPTSVLVYENLDAHGVELFGQQNFADILFLKGTVGLGRVNTGRFDDEDYLAGQVKFLDTTSSVTEGRIAYFTVDLGASAWPPRRGQSSFGAFIGFTQWTEDIDAYGITTTEDLFGIGGDEPDTLLVISNKARWRALRVGFAADLAVAERMRFSLDLAVLPYAKVHNEDSHHLRSDLGPVPNIIKTGRGWGVQADAELRYEIVRRVELGLGLRFWHVEVDKGTRTLPNDPAFPALPLVELESTRYGATLSVRRVW